MAGEMIRSERARVEVKAGLYVEHEFEVRPAACFDLDGTVRRSKADPNGFIRGPEDVELFEGVEEELWRWREKGFLIFGVSNQGGVAFGHKTPAGAEAELAATLALFRRNPFHAAKLCYHMPGGFVPYGVRSLLRKPDYGMLALMEAEIFAHRIVVDWDRSFVVGDREEDAELAERAELALPRVGDALAHVHRGQRDLPPEDGVAHLRRAGEGHVGHPHAREPLEGQRREVVVRADAGGAVGDALRVGAGEGHQLSNRSESQPRCRAEW